MANLEGPKILEMLANNIINTSFEQIDSPTVENTKTRILDTMGGAIGGIPLPDIKALVKIVRHWGGKREASIVGYGVKAPVQNVALVNCTMCRGFDRGPLAYEFNGRTVPHHVSETTVFTALALAEMKGVNGRDLITALILGDDIAGRLHLANDHPLPGEYHRDQKPSQPLLQQMGIQTTTFGAAAIAGRLLGLTRLQMKNALGLVGSADNFGGGIWDGAPTFKIGQGTAAMNGIVAAQLAKEGWTGAIDPFFNERNGMFRQRLDHPEVLFGDLGKKFFVEVKFKPFPGGGPTQAPTAAGIAIARKYHVAVDDIEEAILRTSPGVATGMHYARPYKVGDYPPGDALFSYKYAVANSLARGTAGNKDYTEKAVRDPKVQSLIGKVKLALAELPKSEGVELEVRLKDGHKFSEYVAQAQGDPAKPLSRDTLVGKFMEQVDFSEMISRKNAQKLIDLIDNLEKVDNVHNIMNLAIKDLK